MKSCIFLAAVTTVCLVTKPAPANTFDGDIDTSQEVSPQNSQVHTGDPCPSQPELENGASSLDEGRSNAFYRCNPGYTLYGPNDNTLRCQDGQWFGVIPVCSARGCQGSPVVDSAMITRENRNSVREFKCYPGYEREGSAFIYCDGSRWRNELPRCVSARRCPEPPIVTHARMVITADGLGVTYTCFTGYQPRLGSSTIHCGTDSRWIGNLAVCARVRCRVPGVHDISNGVIAIEHSMVLKIRCHLGYDLVGSSALFCDGQWWNGSLPRCRPHQPPIYPSRVENGTQCGNISAIPNSVLPVRYDRKRDVRRITFYAVRYICKPGFTLQPAGYAVYCSGGNVVGTLPHCYARCGRYNGGCQHVCTNTVRGAVCSCRDGFKMADDGKRCTEIIACGRFLPTSNGYQLFCNTTDMRIGTRCNLTCSEGYEREGSLQIRCNLNEAEQVGQWSTTTGRCNAKTCPILVAEMHMRIIPPDCMERQMDYKSQCFYECTCGFQLRGVSSKTCQADGAWSDPSVQNRCIDIEPPEFTTCPDDIFLPTDPHQNFASNPANWDEPEARDNGGVPVIEASPSATQDQFYLDEVTVITYTARDDAGLENTCTFRITVKAATCPILVEEMRMRIIPPDSMERQMDYKSQCFYECDRGFQLRGVSSRTCQADGTWSDPSVQNRCIDIEPPDFTTCPDDISLSTDLHQNFASNPANWDQPEAQDNDGVPVIEASPSATQERFYLDEVSVITYTARDGAGLESTCTFSITVIDEEPPRVINCPDSFAVKTDNRLAVVDWDEPVFQDNSGHDVSVIFNRPSGSTFFFGPPESIWYIAEDQAGNTARCEFTVSEEDLEPPEFTTCPGDILLPTNLHENFTTTTWDQPEARDNIGTPIIEASPSAAKERFYLNEVTVITYTAQDRAGHESTCTFNITVKDEEPPQRVRCPDSIEVEIRRTYEIVQWEEPVFQDNSGKEVTVKSDFPSGSFFFCSLLETVQYIAEDQAGNTVICEFTVNVKCSE